MPRGAGTIQNSAEGRCTIPAPSRPPPPPPPGDSIDWCIRIIGMLADAHGRAHVLSRQQLSGYNICPQVVHTYLHTYIHTHTHSHAYIHIHIHTHTHTHTYIYTHIHTYMYVHTYIHVHTYFESHSVEN